MAAIRAWWVAVVLAIVVLAGLAGAATAAKSASYSWTLRCTGSHGGSTTSWDWLQNGQVISGAGGTASCSDRGHGTRPTNANGITASLTAWVSGLIGGDSVTKSATLSFDPTKSFELRIDASVTAFVCDRSLHGPGCTFVTEAATFDLTG